MRVSRFALVSVVAALSVYGTSVSETLKDAVEMAYLNNPQLAAQRVETEVAGEQLEQARSQRRPRVTVSGSAGFESVDSNRPFVTSLGERPITTAQFESVLPIYTGGQISAGIRQAEAGIESADSLLDGAGQDLILDVVTAYVDVLRDRQTVSIRENSVALLAEQLRASEDRFDVGDVTQTDVAQSRARYEGSLAALAGAQSLLEGSHATYSFLVGQDAGQLVPPPPAPALPASFEDALQTALQQSPDIRALTFQERAAAEAVEAAYGAMRPSVEIVGSAAFQETYDDNFRDTIVSALARARVPLYQGGQVKSEVKAAKLRRHQAQLRIDNARRQVRAQVAQAWFATVAANQSIEASQRQVEAAEIAYEGAQAELSVGVRTTLDVLDQEQQLLEARLNLTRSERDAYVAAHQLLRAMGGLSVEMLEF